MKNFSNQCNEAANDFYKEAAKELFDEYYNGSMDDFIMNVSLESFKAGAIWYKNQLKSTKSDNYDTTPRNSEVANGIGPIGII